MTDAGTDGAVLLDLDKIEARARAAAGWAYHSVLGIYFAGDMRPRRDNEVFLEYIADMDPPTTLALVTLVRRLTAERDAMREALKPFAAYVEAVDPDGHASDRSELGGDIVGAFRRSITFGQMRRAAALIAGTAREE